MKIALIIFEEVTLTFCIIVLYFCSLCRWSGGVNGVEIFYQLGEGARGK